MTDRNRNRNRLHAYSILRADVIGAARERVARAESRLTAATSEVCAAERELEWARQALDRAVAFLRAVDAGEVSP